MQPVRVWPLAAPPCRRTRTSRAGWHLFRYSSSSASNDIYGSTTQRLTERYPAARVVIIPQVGHVPWLEDRAAFVAAVGTFFD